MASARWLSAIIRIILGLGKESTLALQEFPEDFPKAEKKAHIAGIKNNHLI